MDRTITVKGTGKVGAKPDSAVVFMTLTARDKDYEKAAEAAEKQAEGLQNALLPLHFAETDLKTAELNVNIEYENVRDETGNYRNLPKGFVCTRRLKLQFDFDAARFAAVMKALAGCPAQPEFSVSFTVKDRDALRERALRAAAENAEKRAAILCDAAGVKRGKLLDIRYEWNDRPALSPTRYAAADGRALSVAAFAANVHPEDIDISDTAVFTWEIF